MRKVLLSAIFISVFALMAKAQTSSHVFDTMQFNKQLEFANHLIEYEFYTQLAVDKFSKMPETADSEWFSYQENNTWHSVGGKSTGSTFEIKNHVTYDSLYILSDYRGISDTTKLNALAYALANANTQFQIIRDTSSIYFNSFVISNDDQTISIWYLPAFQPSGQAIYGCEWEYIFDKAGKNLLRKNAYINIITGVWIGQPRELWLNYRNTGKPTIGSVFFALSFRDYFTRIRIDTRISTSTTSKDADGVYNWLHKIK
jgi:hypothetical protein